MIINAMVVTTTDYVIEFFDVGDGTTYVQCRTCGRYGIKPQPHACVPINRGGNWYTNFETVVAIRARQHRNAYRLMNYLSTPADAPVDAQEALDHPAVLDVPAEEAPCQTPSTESLIIPPENSNPEQMATAP